MMHLLLDSGAYSAWRQGKPINIEQYCDFIKKNEYWVKEYVSLDVINPQDPEAAAKESFANYLYMRKQGLKPLCVYHVHEDISWLYRMLDAGAEYIGLSVTSVPKKDLEWYAAAWSHLVTSDGRPIVRTHAFGEGRYQALINFPWQSADSTNWIRLSNFADIQVADGFKLNRRKAGKQPSKGNRHIDSLDENETEILETLLAEVGITLAGLHSGGAISRTLAAMLSLNYYLKMEQRINAQAPITYHPRRFNQTVVTAPAVPINRFHMYMCLGGNPADFITAHYGRATHVLSSYFFLRTETQVNQLKDLVTDVDAAIERWPVYKRYHTILKAYVNEQHGTEGLAKAIQSGLLREGLIGDQPSSGIDPDTRQSDVPIRDTGSQTKPGHHPTIRGGRPHLPDTGSIAD